MRFSNVGLEGGSLAPIHKIYYIIYIFIHIDNNLCNDYNNEIANSLGRVRRKGGWQQKKISGVEKANLTNRKVLTNKIAFSTVII